MQQCSYRPVVSVFILPLDEAEEHELKQLTLTEERENLDGQVCCGFAFGNLMEGTRKAGGSRCGRLHTSPTVNLTTACSDFGNKKSNASSTMTSTLRDPKTRSLIDSYKKKNSSEQCKKCSAPLNPGATSTPNCTSCSCETIRSLGDEHKKLSRHLIHITNDGATPVLLRRIRRSFQASQYFRQSMEGWMLV